MTPSSLACDLEASVAFLRDIVGYSSLPGETSDVEAIKSLQPDERALVLAWHWPHGGFEDGFDPFEEFTTQARRRPEADLRQDLRALIGTRLLSFLTTAATATNRPLDEVLAGTCWLSTCSGENLLGVMEGTHGLSFQQICRVAEALGVRYVDPQDELSKISQWMGVTSEVRNRIVETVLTVIEAALGAASWALARRVKIARAAETSEGLGGALRPYENLLPGLNDALVGLSDEEILVRSRAALSYEPSVSLKQLSHLVVEVARGPEAAKVPLQDLLTEMDAETTNDLVEAVHHAGTLVRHAASLGDEIRQGFGWLLLERGAVGEKIGTAISALDSVTAARTAMRKRFYQPDFERVPAPGDTYVAPAPGTRYRKLYEALASAEDLPSHLRVDPDGRRIETPTLGWLSLPPSAVRDRAWWSGAEKSAIGRPQVLAWRAAGFNTPRLKTDADGRIVSARFTALPGRERWLEDDVETRLARGRFTVPPADNTPLHAVLSYDKQSVWRMGAEDLADLHVAITRRPPRASTVGVAPVPRQSPLTDSDAIEALVAHLRSHGEMDRADIEAFFASDDSGPSAHLDLEPWLRRVLAKASRQGRIANIGTRKQPRWVESGSAAHLAGLLTRTLESNSEGVRDTRLTAPRLVPREGVPAHLCRDVIQHVFGDLGSGQTETTGAIIGIEKGERYLTDEGMRAVMAGRRLTNSGVSALLYSVELKQESAWNSAASAAGAFNQRDTPLDEDSILEP